MAADRQDPPEMWSAQVARTSRGQDHHNTLKLGHAFIYVQLFEDDMVETLPDTDYSIKGLKTGYSASGKSDDIGVLRHERVPDDHYELTCQGKTERIELLYHRYRSHHEELPWALRLRGHRK